MTSGFFHFFNTNAQRMQSRASVTKKNRTGRDRVLTKPRRLLTETLEERQLLAVDVLGAAGLSATAEEANFINISKQDISIDAIKAAIQEAANTQEDDVIQIAAGNLKFVSSSDEITIDIDEESYGSVTIIAQGGDLNIDANGLARVFTVKNGSLKLQSVNIANGKSDYGGAIANGGTVTLVDVELSNNEATVSGGAIASKGTLFVHNSIIKDNTAAEDGAAIYEGDFAWPTVAAPEWIKDIEDVKGDKGQTVEIDLSQYCSEGAWTYSFDCANVDSAIFAEEPVLENGVLTLKFIDNADYSPEKDYSAVAFEVCASDGTTKTKTSFNVAHKCQTSAVLKATLSNMSPDDVDDEYIQSWKIDGARRGTDVYASENPASDAVDLNAENLSVQLWLKDLASAEHNVVGAEYVGENIWGEYEGNDYKIGGVCFYLTLENATLNLPFDSKNKCKCDKFPAESYFVLEDEMASVVYLGETESGAHLYMIDYPLQTNSLVPCGQYALLGYLQITPDGSEQPVSVTLTQYSDDSSNPTLIRAFDGGYSNLDPSQILFVSCVSDSGEPTSEIPGRPFASALATSGVPTTTSAGATLFGIDSAETGEYYAYEVDISNTLIVGNTAAGKGVVYVADGEANIVNTTIADNVATDAALYCAYSGEVEEGRLGVDIGNSIIVNGELPSMTSNVVGYNNLVVGTPSDGEVVYDSSKPLFNEGGYTLAVGSQALNIGDDDSVFDCSTWTAPTTDLAGNPRFSGTVDAGAYEYQGTAPNAPTNVDVSDYVDSAKKPTISWEASTAVDGVEGYYVYYGESKQATTKTSFDVTTLTSLADNSTYEFRVSAFNAYGESGVVKVTLDTLVAPTAPTGLAFGEYANGSATLTWTTVSNAAYYQIKDASGKVVADNIADGSYTFTGLADFSTYAFTVVAVNAKGSAASEAISLDTTVASAIPTGFKVGTKYADNQLTLTWNAVDQAAGYVVYQKVDGKWNAISDQSETSFTVSNLKDFTTYEFAVASYAKKGDATLTSETTTLSTYTAVKPNSPSNFVLVSEYAGEGSVAVQWDAVTNADGYLLAKKETSGWTVVATIDSTNYTVNGLANNAEYEYGVAAYALDDDNLKLQSDFTSLTFSTVVAPSAPTNVKFAEYLGGTSATLTWNAVSGVSGYEVEIKNAQGVWESVGTTTNNSLAVTVSENSYYVYRVASFNTVGGVTKTSEYVEASLDTLVPPTGDLSLSVVDYSYSAGTAKLTWNALDAASYYVVEVKAGEGAWTTVQQKNESNSYDLTALQPNASYSFRVTAANGKGKGVSTSIDYFTAAPPTKPTVNYNYDKDAKTATISYSSAFATEYSVYQAGTLVYKGAETSYQATNLVDNESYSFMVVASNKQGDSEAAEITFTASAAPQAPVVTISAYENNVAVLTWTAVEFANGYRVYQQNGNAWVKVGSDLGVDVREYSLTNLQDYANYAFAVVAFNEQGESPYSGVVTLDTTVAPATPTGLAFDAEYAGDGKASLVWNAVEYADGYLVKYVLNGESCEVVVKTNAFEVEGLANYEEYTFVVAAFATRGEENLYSADASIVLDTTIVPNADLNVSVSDYDYVKDEATLSWNEVAHATGYKITLTEFGKSTNTFDTTETSYKFSSLKDNVKYTYSVVAYNGKGDGSKVSGEFFTAAPPATPNAYFSAYDADKKQATLIWNSVDYATSYKVQVFDVEKNDWVDVELNDAQLTQYVVTDMVDFASYRFRVAASNATGDSDWREVSITATTTPLAPYDLEYSYNGKTKIATISWSDDLNPINVGYKIYQWNDETEVWDFKANNAYTAKSYTSVQLERYSEYKFAVTSWVRDESGHILESAKEDATIIVDTDWTPGNIEEAYFENPEDYNGDGTAKLVWSAAEGASWYEIYLKVDGEKVLYATTTETSYKFEGDLALANYENYDFVIVATNDYKGEGGNVSLEKSVSFSTMIAPTEELTVVVGEYDFKADSLKLTWNEVAFADGYKVYLTQNDEETLVGTIEESEYTFTELTDNAEYGFKVVAYNAKGDGSQFVGKFFTSAPPAAPIDAAFGEYVENTHKATLSWSSVDYAVGYSIQVKNGDEWQDVVKSWKTNNYAVENLVDDSIYVYRVCAYNDKGYSDYVEAVLDTSVKTAPKAPSDLTVVYDSKNDLATLTWKDNSGNETGFVVQRSYDNKNWVELAKVDANVASYDLGELSVGVTYYYRVASTNAYGYSDWDVVAYAIPTPNAPTDLVVGKYDELTYSVDLSWIDNSDDEQGFKVEWSNDQKTWYSDYVGANDGSDEVVYRKTKLIEGRTYYFRVSAYNKAGSSDYATAIFDVPAVERQKPNAPSDVQFVDYNEETHSVTMNWTDNSDDEEKFVVQFSYDKESWYSVANVNYDVATLKIEGLVEGRTYNFRVAAYNAAGYSEWSEGSFSVATRVLDAPIDFTVEKLTNSSVRLGWTDNSSFEDGFLLQYSYDAVNWSRVGYLDANTTTYDFAVVSGRSYYFRVAAYYGNTTSEWLDSQKYDAPVAKPDAPTGLSVEETKNGVTLNWTDNSNNEIGFNVEYSLDGGKTWIASGKTGANVATKSVSNLRVGASYTFRVRAYNSQGSSSWISESYTFVNTSAPDGPANLTLGDYDSASNSISLGWGFETEEPDVYGYRVQYSYDGGISWYSAGTTSKGDLDSVVSGLVGGRTYMFRVASYNADGASEWIESEGVDIPLSDSAPKAPTGLACSYDEGAKAVKLTWKDNSDVEKGYRVEYSDDGAHWSDYAYLEANSTQREITGLDAGETYYFNVVAYNAYGESAADDKAQITIENTSGVVAPEFSSMDYKPSRRQITLGWSATGASYNVQYRYCWKDDAEVESHSSWYSLTSGTNSNSATLKNVTAGVKYEFRVQAVNENDDLSAWSKEKWYDTGSMTSALDEVVQTTGAEFFDDLDADSLDAIALSLL